MPLDDHEQSSKELLHPYLQVILGLNPTCQSIFQLFYVHCVSSASNQPFHDIIPNFFMLPYLQEDVFQSVDQAACDAENAFWSVMQVMGLQSSADREKGFWIDDTPGDNDE